MFNQVIVSFYSMFTRHSRNDIEIEQKWKLNSFFLMLCHRIINLWKWKMLNANLNIVGTVIDNCMCSELLIPFVFRYFIMNESCRIKCENNNLSWRVLLIDTCIYLLNLTIFFWLIVLTSIVICWTLSISSQMQTYEHLNC